LKVIATHDWPPPRRARADQLPTLPTSGDSIDGGLHFSDEITAQLAKTGDWPMPPIRHAGSIAGWQAS